MPELIDRGYFFTTIRNSVFKGSMTQEQVDGMIAILNAWDATHHNDLRYLAYMLGTTYHETAHTMQPIREYGTNTYFNRMYDIEGEHPQRAKGLGNHNPGDGVKFCGRGYVQLTGGDNYRKGGELCGVDLENNPDLAMNPEIAMKLMIVGMTGEGLTFTGRKLEHYFNDEKTDWVNARRIINADVAKNGAMIGRTAQEFHKALRYL